MHSSRRVKQKPNLPVRRSQRRKPNQKAECLLSSWARPGFASADHLLVFMARVYVEPAGKVEGLKLSGTRNLLFVLFSERPASGRGLCLFNLCSWKLSVRAEKAWRGCLLRTSSARFFHLMPLPFLPQPQTLCCLKPRQPGQSFPRPSRWGDLGNSL